MRRLRLLVWVVFFFAMIVGTKTCLDYAVADEPKVLPSDCCIGWEPCPGRPTEWHNGRPLVWYCGPKRN